MTEANAPVLIFEGDFLLRQEGNEIKTNGKIRFNWLPNYRTNITCSIPKDQSNAISALQDAANCDVMIDGLKFGECFFTRRNFAFKSDAFTIDLEGVLVQFAVIGDKSIPVEKIRFEIPNLREFRGLPVKVKNDDGTMTISRAD